MVEAQGAVVEGKVSNVFSVDQVETRGVVDVGKAAESAEDAVERPRCRRSSESSWRRSELHTSLDELGSSIRDGEVGSIRGGLQGRPVRDDRRPM